MVFYLKYDLPTLFKNARSQCAVKKYIRIKTHFLKKIQIFPIFSDTFSTASGKMGNIWALKKNGVFWEGGEGGITLKETRISFEK